MATDSKPAISVWTVETLDHRVDREIAALAEDLRARFIRIADLLRTHGPHRVREPYVKPLAGKLWEMRMSGRDGIARAIYLAATGRRLVVVHVFEKKSEKTPKAAIEIATDRAKKAGLI